MKVERDGRRLRFSELPERADGLRMLPELEVYVEYAEEPRGAGTLRKALTLDNVVMPAIVAALEEMSGETVTRWTVQRRRLRKDGTPNGRGWQDFGSPQWDEGEARSCMRRARENNARIDLLRASDPAMWGYGEEYRIVKTTTRREVIDGEESAC